MRILIACEQSGLVREAFRKLGHEAFSCDIVPSEIPGHHIQDDVRNHFNEGWDMMIAFPPCTYLAISGAAYFSKRLHEQKEALCFVSSLMNAPIDRIAIENPVGVINSKIRRPDQIVHPFYFGDPIRKATCLWLNGLPRLVPTKIVKPDLISTGDGKVYSLHHYNSWGMPAEERRKFRSRTSPGVAHAMAEQWQFPTEPFQTSIAL